MADELSEYQLARFEEPEEGSEERETFRIESDEQATWALRKMAHYEAELARLKERAAEETAAIAAWLTDASSGTRHQVEWFEAKLTEWHRRQLVLNPELTGRKKSYRVPGGTVEIGRASCRERG